MIEQYLEPPQPVVSDEEKGRQVILDNQAVIQTFLSQPHIQQLFQNFKDEDGNPIPPSLRQIHLHLHTPKGSLLDGFARIDDLMPLSREYGMPAVGVSEHGTMASHFDFYHAANEAGIKPIMGMEAYVTTNHKWKKPDFERVFYEMHNYGTPEEPLIHPKLYHISSEEMQKGGYTNVIEIKDSTIQKLMARIVESRFIQEIKQEYIQREEKPPSQAIIKKEVTRRKTASTRQGLRFCVKEKTQVRDLFSWRPHNNNHLLLIARTQEGYSNMLKLCSTGFLEGFYYKPRLDHHLLKKHAKGLIATSACLGSDINQCLLLGRDRVAKNLIKFYHKIFDEFYLEIQPSEQPEQHYVNKRLKEFSKEMGIPLICTTDVHMLKKEEKALHATITTIGQSEDTDGISVYDSCYFMSTEEILGKGIPIEAVMNTMEVAAKCNVALADDSIKFPVYDVPKGETFDSYLKKLSTNALFYYALHQDIDIDAYMKRLNYELEVVAKKNISAYFIIVWDYIKFARGRGILVGPGRGSAAGSLISFLLRITNLDPIKYDLLFSRFINPERPGFPDVDSDFDDKRRHEVIEYVTNKYGADRVSQIGTFSMLNTKSVLKDVGRSLGIDHVEINSMNKFVPVHQGKSPTVDECLTLVPEFEAYEQKYPELFKTAIKIQGMPRTSSVHACGIMITPTPIDDFVPLTAGKNGERVSQYDGPSLEKSGFIKFDFLGLKNLSVINIARQLVKERHGIDIDPDALEPDDDVVFSTIGNGKTQGIFQLESSGMTKVFTGLDKVDFESLIAGVSLYRPGPMAHIPEYQQRANGYKDVSFFHEDANEVLSTTFGIMIYQEQLMRLAGIFGGYSEGAQDTLRKATGKKSQEVMNKVLPELKEAVIKKGYDESTADKLVELIEPFVGYGLQNV